MRTGGGKLPCRVARVQRGLGSSAEATADAVSGLRAEAGQRVGRQLDHENLRFITTAPKRHPLLGGLAVRIVGSWWLKYGSAAKIGVSVLVLEKPAANIRY